MQILKILKPTQIALRLLLLVNIFLFGWGSFIVHLKYSYFNHNREFVLEMLGLLLAYLVLVIGHLLNKESFIRWTFLLLFLVLPFYGVYIQTYYQYLPLTALIGAALSFFLFFLSALAFVLSCYIGRITSRSKISKFSITHPCRTWSVKLIKIIIGFGLVLTLALPIVFFAQEYLWNFGANNLQVYGFSLTLLMLGFITEITSALCHRDVSKMYISYNFWFVAYTYGLFIVLVFALTNQPLKITIWPIITGVLLCIFAILLVINILISLIYNGALYEAYDYILHFDLDQGINKIKKHIVLGIIIMSSIAYELATSLAPSINYFFLK